MSEESLLNAIAHGGEPHVSAYVYGGNDLSFSERRFALDLLSRLHAPSADQSLTIVERQASGRFTLLILRVPWLAHDGDPASGYHPLLVAEQGNSYRAVGYVLPWNEIIPQFSAEEMGQIQSLSIRWIVWLSQRRTATA